MVVWAHHMLLTGMSTTLSSFFQITTMAVSVPSVILITSLVVTLWGGAIRYTTAMCFALAFLPMFGLGGVTGLPLGLGPSNLILHDTYYVIGHFHYLVAPGTMFALFAAIYHWFPKVTGRRLDERLGLVHFIGSFVAMNAVFLPMFLMGIMGVNRRMYDAGLQYQLAEPTLAWNPHMTWSAVALGVFQLVFVFNVVWSAKRGVPAENPWQATTLEWATSSPPPAGNFAEPPVVTGAPYRYEEERA
jgi:cytochrome c oxidase subunit 1